MARSRLFGDSLFTQHFPSVQFRQQTRGHSAPKRELEALMLTESSPHDMGSMIPLYTLGN